MSGGPGSRGVWVRGQPRWQQHVHDLAALGLNTKSKSSSVLQGLLSQIERRQVKDSKWNHLSATGRIQRLVGSIQLWSAWRELRPTNLLPSVLFLVHSKKLWHVACAFLVPTEEKKDTDLPGTNMCKDWTTSIHFTTSFQGVFYLSQVWTVYSPMFVHFLLRKLQHQRRRWLRSGKQVQRKNKYA